MCNISYNTLLSLDNLIEVYENIKKNTRHKGKIVQFELFYSSNIVSILEELADRNYRHKGYEVFLIDDPRYRVIMSETIEDKIVNHLVSQYALMPILERKMIDQNVAVRKDRGTKRGIYYFKKYINHLKENHNDIYILKCDISKYFYNIDHKILLDNLKRDIEDPELYDLVEKIIATTDSKSINQKIDRLVERERKRIHSLHLTDEHIKDYLLDTLPRYDVGRGLPIGNETSQVFAIYYLNDLDHYIKEKLGIKYYIRYMDDFLLIHPDREYLKECKKKIEVKVAELNLSLNDKTQIFSIRRGINFLGYRFILKNKRLIILINQKNKRKIKRRLHKLQKKNNIEKYEEVIVSYNGYFQNAHTREFRHSLNLKRKKKSDKSS